RIRGTYRPPARLLPDISDRHAPEHGPGGPPGTRLRIPDHRVQGRRQESRRLASGASRGGAAGARGRAPAIDRRGRRDARARQVRTGRVTRLAEFGAFVELEPGVEGLAHASTFAPTGQSWTRSVGVGMTGAFEILSIDPDKKRIGVALVQEGSARAQEAEEVRE